MLWASIALAGAVLLTALVDGAVRDRRGVLRRWRSALHASVDPDDPAAVTRAELGVILLGMAAGLGTAAALAPPLSLALLAAAILVPAEIALSGAAHRDLMAARAGPRRRWRRRP